MSKPFVTVEVDSRGFAIISLVKEPVNSLDMAMWKALDESLDQIIANPKISGVIFSSGLRKNVFSAGNDLKELYVPETSLPRFKAFWSLQNRFLAKLFSCRLLTLSAVRGSCPAGGCVLSLCCDHRLMTKEGVFGLNEVALGISVPKFWAMLFQQTVGSRSAADRMLFAGKLLTPPEALAAGLVDELVDDPERLMDVAKAKMARLLKGSSPLALAETKKKLRACLSEQWVDYIDEESGAAWVLLSSPETVARLKSVIDRLSKGGPSSGSKL